MANKPETQMPHVDPRVTDPQAVRYASDVAKRRAATPVKYVTPTAGGPTPPVPLLDSQPQFGKTMAEQGAQRVAVPPQPGGAPSIFGPQPPPMMPPMAPTAHGAPQPPLPPLNILPMDMLPDHAMQDPAFNRGMGAQYAASQPELARRYGVMRNGQFIAPQQLVPPPPPGAKPQLRPSTVEDLKTLSTIMSGGTSADQPSKQDEEEVERAAKSGVAGQVAKAGGAIPDMVNEFDVARGVERLTPDLFNNKEQRELIESRLKPMDIGELVINGYVRQRVPIVPGRLEVEFQSMSGEEDLAIKRIVMQDANTLAISENYHIDRFSIMALAVGVFAINDKPLPSHMKDGVFDDAAFMQKFNTILRLPMPLLNALGTNYFWFDIRVRKMLLAVNLKNG